MSCHGCRALRKGCPNDCTLRAALQWIEPPESKANATLFLAKFYGRTGLINLLNAGPTNLRSEILRSLLYEACGRYIDPVHGSLGLLCSGYWAQCQTAMESVLRIGRVQIPAGDNGSTTAFVGHARARTRVKRYAGPDHVDTGFVGEPNEAKFTISGWDQEQMNHDNNSFSVEKVQPVYPNLELSLGVNPAVSKTNISSVIDISDNET